MQCVRCEQNVVPRSLHPCAQVHLPSVAPPSLMHQLAEHMMGRSLLQRMGVQRPDVERLLEWSGGSPAMFVDMVQIWARSGGGADRDGFAADYMRDVMQAKVWAGCVRFGGCRDCCMWVGPSAGLYGSPHTSAKLQSWHV